MVTEFSELIKKKSLPPYTNNSRIRQKFRQISHLTLPPPSPLLFIILAVAIAAQNTVQE